jgi:hypothetical protein
VSFHVEISSSLQHARVFNLSREELLATVVEPWLAGRHFELAEHKWEPGESTLKILEGRHLDNPDLAFGQGWSNALRTAENVTKQVLEEAPAPSAPDAFVIETELPEATVAELLGGRDARPVSWAEAAERTDGRDPSVAAVILVVRRRS